MCMTSYGQGLKKGRHRLGEPNPIHAFSAEIDEEMCRAGRGPNNLFQWSEAMFMDLGGCLVPGQSLPQQLWRRQSLWRRIWPPQPWRENERVPLVAATLYTQTKH
jgi:hypothetical protein